MTTSALHLYRTVERIALIAAIVCALGAGLLAWLEPGHLATAWRLAVFMCLQPALGSLIFVLIHRLTGGQWGHGLAPFLLSGTRLLPWVWLLVLPLLWCPLAGDPDSGHPAADSATNFTERTETRDLATSTPAESQRAGIDTALLAAFGRSESRHAGDGLRWYFSRPVVATRAVLYALVFALLAFGAPRAMRAVTTMRWFGPLGLIALVFLLHLLATDWFVMLDPGWFSTGFPLVWISSQAIAGIATAVGVGALFGADLPSTGRAGHTRGLDWGNLLLASIMVWAYVAFVQLLIIWSGNLPPETAWYRHRMLGAWRWISVAVAVVAFAGPFALLLSRAAKQRRALLGAIAATIVIGQFGYTAWLVVPAFPAAAQHAPGLLAATFAAAVALWFNRYLAGARVAAAKLTA